MPTLRGLAARGALARSVESVFPSTTWPSHATIVTGVRPHRHGVVANSILDRATGVADIAPTLAHLLGFALPGVEGRILREILET